MTVELSLSHIIGDVILILIIYIGGAILILLYIQLNRKLDRYRLKYGFDKELEAKDMSEKNKEQSLDKIERRFKRRVFID